MQRTTLNAFDEVDGIGDRIERTVRGRRFERLPNRTERGRAAPLDVGTIDRSDDVPTGSLASWLEIHCATVAVEAAADRVRRRTGIEALAAGFGRHRNATILTVERTVEYPNRSEVTDISNVVAATPRTVRATIIYEEHELSCEYPLYATRGVVRDQ